MSVTMTLTKSGSGGGLNISETVTVTGDNANTFNTSIADSVTDQLLTISLDVDNLKGYIFTSTQDITIETNDPDTYTDQISLRANEPLVWTGENDLYTNLLTQDVTAMYLTNASGSAAVLKMIIVQDATPA